MTRGDHVGQMAIRFLLEGDEAAGGAIAFRVRRRGGRAGADPAQPRRLRGDDVGLEGILTWTVDGVRTEVGPGEALFIPRGVVHQFENVLRHGRDGARDRDAGRARPGILPRPGGDRRRGCRWPARPRRDRRGDARARPDAGAVDSGQPRYDASESNAGSDRQAVADGDVFTHPRQVEHVAGDGVGRRHDLESAPSPSSWSARRFSSRRPWLSM